MLIKTAYMMNNLRKSIAAALLLVAGSGVANAQSQGIITTIAGSGTAGFSGDGGAAISAQFSSPQGVTVDAAGNVFVADAYNQRIRKIDAVTGIISTYAGGGLATSYGIAPTTASLDLPTSLYIGSSGTMLITDHYYDMTFYIDNVSGNIYSRCGCHSQGCDGDGGPSFAARMELPASSCEDTHMNTYIADQGCGKVRKVDAATGLASTLATVSGPGAVFFDPSSYADLYVTELYNHKIIKINVVTGAVTDVVGTGASGYSGDGADALSATIGYPVSLFIDHNHNLYFSDQTYNVVRYVDLTTGKIYTLAGTGVAGFSGDGNVAPFAQLNSPREIWVNDAGYIYIADAGNNRIRMVKPKGLKPLGATADVNTLTVYPNPSTGIFTLSTDAALENSDVIVLDMMGRQVYNAALSGFSNVIDLHTQAHGVYTLIVKTASGVHSQKLTIQ